MCYFYDNKTTNKTLEEKLKFKMSGLQIVGAANENVDEVNIKIGPG